jgi:nucleotide-binding universal stress UspA family protein
VFSKILVPVDGSKYSDLAVDIAIMIAKKFQSKITLLHVSSLITSLSLDIYTETQLLTQDDITKLINSTREAGFHILAQGQERVEAEQIPVKTLFKEGHAIQEIIRVAREGRFDLLVLGVKGKSKIKELQLGSVTEKVVRNAPCTVMIVK